MAEKTAEIGKLLFSCFGTFCMSYKIFSAGDKLLRVFSVEYPTAFCYPVRQQRAVIKENIRTVKPRKEHISVT